MSDFILLYLFVLLSPNPSLWVVLPSLRRNNRLINFLLILNILRGFTNKKCIYFNNKILTSQIDKVTYNQSHKI